MNDLIMETLKLTSDVARDAYKAGHDEGYRLGFKEGIDAAKRIIDEHFPKPIEGKAP